MNNCLVILLVFGLAFGTQLADSDNFGFCLVWKFLNPASALDCRRADMDWICTTPSWPGGWKQVTGMNGVTSNAYITCKVVGDRWRGRHIQIDGPVFVEKPNLLLPFQMFSKDYFPQLELIYVSTVDEWCHPDVDCNIPTLSLPESVDYASTLSFFGLDSISLKGQIIPPKILQIPSLFALSITNNGFTGTMPDFKNQKSLQVIILNENFVGTMPALDHLPWLYTMLLQGTSLSGTIPNLGPKITKLRLRKNPKLGGTFPGNIAKLTALRDLSLSNNGFTALSESSLGPLTQVTRLSLQHNDINATIPSRLSALEKIQYLDINYNSFYGTIPALPPTLTFFNAAENYLSGSVPSIPTKLRTLDLSSNLLSGNLVKLFTRENSFYSLKLEQNAFSGQLPPRDIFWKAINEVTVLKLNNNLLEGTVPIPLELGDVKTSKPSDFDFSWNKFTGRAPTINAGSIDYVGNRMELVYPSFPSSISVDYINGMMDRTSDLPSFVEPMISLVPQDFNECTSPDQKNLCVKYATCVDGWSPPLSYTCKCNTGYQPNLTSSEIPNQQKCYPICGDGKFVEGEICDFRVTTLGCTQLCTVERGFTCKNTGECENICGDSLVVGTEECDPPQKGCGPQCKITQGYECAVFPCTKLRDINECATLTDNCGWTILGSPTHHDRCINTDGAFRCCDTGFTNPGTGVCQDVDECRYGHNCKTTSMCVNTPGSFYCCEPGYESNTLGVGPACIDVDECKVGGHNCKTTSMCVNTPGSFYCCEPGYEANPIQNATAPACIDIDECQRGHNCSSFSQCINTIGSFFCCASGFVKSSKGPTCVGNYHPTPLLQNCSVHFCTHTRTGQPENGSPSG